MNTIDSGFRYQPERSGKLDVSDEWKKKIAALGTKQAGEVAQWVKSGKNSHQAEIMGKNHTDETSAVYKDFVESHGGKMSGMVKQHNLADIQARTANGGGKLGNKYTSAWHEIFSAAFKAELGNSGIESAPIEEGGFNAKNDGPLDMLL